MTNKLERDGKVAVLYSPGFGAGWSTWNPEHAEFLIFDAELVQAALEDNKPKLIALVKLTAPDMYTGGVRDLQVKWLPKGTRFEITEYDGSESIRVFDDSDYFIA
jgi:hypothetical protein